MWVDNSIHEQVRKIAELFAAIDDAAKGRPHEESEEELREAMRQILSIDPALADRIDGRSLVRMVIGPEKTEALLMIIVGRADLARQRGESTAAMREYGRAREMLEEAKDSAPGVERWPEIERRIDAGLAGCGRGPFR